MKPWRLTFRQGCRPSSDLNLSYMPFVSRLAIASEARLPARNGAPGSVPQMTPAELASALAADSVAVVDVRGRAEWEAGHLPGVENIPVGYLEDRLEELPRDRPLVLHCQAGARSAIAASVLRAHGFDNVINMSSRPGMQRATRPSVANSSHRPFEQSESTWPALR